MALAQRIAVQYSAEAEASRRWAVTWMGGVESSGSAMPRRAGVKQAAPSARMGLAPSCRVCVQRACLCWA